MRVVSGHGSYRAGVGFGVLTFGSNALIAVVSSIAIARLYGIDVLGEWALVFAPATIMGSLSSVREQTAFVRDLASLQPREPRVTGLFVAILAFSSVLTLAVGLVVMAVSWILYEGPVGTPDLVAPAAITLAGYIAIANLSWNVDMVFSGFRAGRVLFWVRLHQSLAFTGLAVIAALFVDSVWGLVVAMLAAWATSLVHRVFALRGYVRARVGREEIASGFRALPEMIRFGMKIAPGSIAEGISYQSGTWALGIAGSVPDVGAYNRAWMLGSRLVDLKNRITEMLFPTLVERRTEGDAVGYDRALLDSIRYAAAGMLLIVSVAGGAAHGVMALFGPGFDRAADALAIVLLFPVLATLADMQFGALWAANRPLSSTAVAVSRMCVVVTLSAVLVGPLGINGVAIALTAGYAVGLLAVSRLTRTELSGPVRALFPARAIVALPLAYAAGFVAARVTYGAVDELWMLPLAGAIGVLAYLATLLAMGALLPRDRARLASAVGALRERRAARRVGLAGSAGE
jgi:O-antigen/teichoic acid export membrane protein